MTEKELTVIELTEENIESMVYEIRGQKVMLDFDLARIYGYETKYLNRQVQRNIDKFPKDFMFQLNETEIIILSRCQNVTSKNSVSESEESLWCQNVTLKNSVSESEESLWSKKTALNKSGNLRGKHIKYLPYAFTEQGIYMLMTVLKGELATKQSIALIKAFKRMKDYLVSSNYLVNANELLKLSNQVNKNTSNIDLIEKKLEMVMDNFIDPSKYKEFVFLCGEKLEADIAYQSIYSKAKKTIIVVDDYIDIKTLHLLRSATDNIEITIFSDNKAKNSLTKSFINDFNKVANKIKLYRTNNKCHDRLIILDYKQENETIYVCGSSSKDSGNKATTINRIDSGYLFHKLIDSLFDNDLLTLL